MPKMQMDNFIAILRTALGNGRFHCKSRIGPSLSTGREASH